MEPGTIVGEVALFCAGGRSADVSALVETRLVTVSRADFMAFLAENPDATGELLRGMAERIRHLSDHVVEARFATLPERLHQTLMTLSRLDERGVIRISQADLGDMGLASREIVNRQLNAWRAAGLIQLRRKESRSRLSSSHQCPSKVQLRDNLTSSLLYFKLLERNIEANPCPSSTSPAVTLDKEFINKNQLYRYPCFHPFGRAISLRFSGALNPRPVVYQFGMPEGIWRSALGRRVVSGTSDPVASSAISRE
jgi:hypothetical protein